MGIVVATVTSDTTPMDPAVDLLSLEIRKQVDKVPEATLVLLDGSIAKQEFALSNQAFFAPGKKINVKLRYEGKDDVQVFEGLVVRQVVEATAEGTELRVELKDVAYVLTRQRKSAVHRKQRDDELVSTLIKDTGVEAGELAPSTVKHDELIQYYASDWDFLLARADVNGQVVVVDDGKLSLVSMSQAAQPKASFEFGRDGVHEFELELDASRQWAAVNSVAWDVAQQEPAAGAEANVFGFEAGNLDVPSVASKLGGAAYALMLPAGLAPAELEPWAKARLARSRLAQLRGRLLVDGRGDIKPFDRIELAGVGDRFNGKLIVGGVTHRVDSEGWRTELQLGLSPEWFARTPDIADVQAGGLLPPVLGLQIGKIDAFEADPSGEHRVRLRMATLDEEQGPVWARVARPDAGDGRGFAFWPELGDEVVVGFLAGDPRQAVVLGSLFGSVNKPPKPVEGPRDGNPKRAIVGRSGTMIVFDDEAPALTVETPGKNSIVIDDKAKAITIKDQHGNTITMDDKGITLKSAADFKIDATGKVEIKGSAVDIL